MSSNTHKGRLTARILFLTTFTFLLFPFPFSLSPFPFSLSPFPSSLSPFSSSLSPFPSLLAQEPVSWLQEHTGKMTVGNDTYQYDFTVVDGNECKLKIEETVTDKRGTDTRSWVFYLSDLDGNALDMDPRGKSIEISMETRNSQNFISYFEEGEFEEYTDEIEMQLTEVDKAREMLEAVRDKIGECKETQADWEDREAAFDWLVSNIGEANEDDGKWEQEFSRGDKPYLAELSAVMTDEDGETESFLYLFDLSDINPTAVTLEASGKTLKVEVQVRDDKRYIELKTEEGKEYTDELAVYADDIETARQIVHALSYLVGNSRAERTGWESYSEALQYVKDNLGEVKADDDLYQYSMEYNASPSGIVDLVEKETDSDGETSEESYSFYLFDMKEKPELDVSSDEIVIELETRNGRDFIRHTEEDGDVGYESDLEIHAGGIDQARDLVHALEYAIANSVEEIEEFATVAEVNGWLMQNLHTLLKDGDQYELSMMADENRSNAIEYTLKVTEEEGEVTESVYLVYPEDIDLEELEIGFSSGRMIVPLETEEDDFIRHTENGALQDYEDEADVYFSDPLDAKNFMAAIRFLKEDAGEREQIAMSGDEAMAFLSEQIPDIELAEETHEQTLEVLDEGNCKLKFTRVETDDDGERDEYIYEFMASDIWPGTSDVSVDGKLVEVNLKTAGEEDLIKPYENGEVEDFIDEFTVYADDVLLARKILAAFIALAEECK